MEKDFVKIKYEGKIKETGQTFDKGDDLCVIVGAGQVLKGLDKELANMKAGEKKTVEIKPKDGLGGRKPEFVKTVPLSEFKKHGTKPVPVMVFKADNSEGRVLSVSGGRVKIDFNHPLAGKVLMYDVEVKAKIENPEDKIKGLIGFYTKISPEQLTVNISDMVEIIAPPLIHPVMKKKIADDVRKYVEKKSVKFSEIFEVPKETVEKKVEEKPEKKE